MLFFRIMFILFVVLLLKKFVKIYVESQILQPTDNSYIFFIFLRMFLKIYFMQNFIYRRKTFYFLYSRRDALDPTSINIYTRTVTLLSPFSNSIDF